jgi:hypothetical protein
MSGLVTTSFRIHLARQFVEQFSEAAPDYLYMFIARALPWADDQSPPTPTEEMSYTEYSIWSNMLAMKRVLSADVSYAVPRYDWTSGTVYDQFSSDDPTLFTKDFYVFTEDYNVYKCLSNYKGTSSTVKPSGTANTPFVTGDGYKWKYVGSVSAPRAIKFLTTNYLPVQDLTVDDNSAQYDVQTSAANGAIETCHVYAGGSNWPYHTGTLQAAAANTATIATGASAVNDFYNSGSIYIASGTGAGQIRQISDYVGSTKVIHTLTAWSVQPDATSTYIVGPRVALTGDGSGFAAYATVSGGAVDKVVITDSGEDYSRASITMYGGAGTSANVVPQLAPQGGHGSSMVNELGARYVTLASRFTGSEANTFITENDYRIVGLVANPQLANGSIAQGTSYDMTTVVAITGLSGTFQLDELVTGGTSGATGYVAQRHGTSALRLTNVTGTFSGAETITGDESSATATVSSATVPGILPFTGRIMYLDHRSPITRDANQVEASRIVIRF